MTNGPLNEEASNYQAYSHSRRFDIDIKIQHCTNSPLSESNDPSQAKPCWHLQWQECQVRPGFPVHYLPSKTSSIR